MPYCTIQDMIAHAEPDAIVGMCSKSAEATLNSEDVQAICNKVIAAAGADIDSYLLGRYGPQLRSLDPIPDSLRYKCALLAVHKLYVRRRQVDDDWEKKHEDTIEWLKWIGEGHGEITAVTATGAAIVEPEHRYQTDAEVNKDSDLDDNDRRILTPSKLKKLFGVP